MSVEALYDLVPANASTVHTNCMKDIMDSALHKYAVDHPDWVEALNMQDTVKGKTVPEYLKDLVETDEIKTVLQNVITAQVAPSVWQDGDPHTTGAWAKAGFSNQQEIRDRGHYYLQSMDDSSVLAADPHFNRLYDYVKCYHTSRQTPDLQPYVNGEGGKTSGEWAVALYNHALFDTDNREDLLTSETMIKDRQMLSKLNDIMGALATPDAKWGSATKLQQALPRAFMERMSLATIGYARQIVASLPLADMQDIVSRQVDLFWQNSQDSTVHPDVSGALQDIFKALGAQDAAATKDFQSKLVQYFVDEKDELIYVADRWEGFFDVLSQDYSTLSQEDLSRVQFFSMILMMSASTTVANFTLRNKNDDQNCQMQMWTGRNLLTSECSWPCR
jgi:hypothetical protein